MKLGCTDMMCPRAVTTGRRVKVTASADHEAGRVRLAVQQDSQVLRLSQLRPRVRSRRPELLHGAARRTHRVLPSPVRPRISGLGALTTTLIVVVASVKSVNVLRTSL